MEVTIMKKFCIIFIFYCCAVIAYSQEKSSKIVNKQKINIEDLTEFTFTDSGQTLILSKGNILEITKGGSSKQLLQSSKNKIKGISFDKVTNSVNMIDNNGLITDEQNIKIIDISQNIRIKSKKMEPNYLTKDNLYYYTCLMHPERRTHSESIAVIDKEGNLSDFAFIVGNPRGLFCQGEHLYYLTDNGILRKYSLKTKKCEDTIELPIKNTYGLVYENNTIYTFFSVTHELIEIQITTK